MENENYGQIFYNDIDIKINLGTIVINILYLRFRPFLHNQVIENHCHSSFELHFIHKGRGIIIINGIEQEVKPGFFYLTGPGIYHKQIPDEIEPMVEYCMNFDYKTVSFPSNTEMIPIKESESLVRLLKESKFYCGKDEYANSELIERALRELKDKEIGYYSSIKNYLFQVIINTLRCFTNNREGNYEAPRKSLDDLRHQLLDDLFGFKYCEINADMVAKELRISKRHLDRVVKIYYGESFNEKLLNVKIDNAKLLLKNSDMTISDISFKTGFNSPNYFSRMFKKKTGISPQDFRHVQI